MVATFKSYFVIFFIIARLVSLASKISWMPIIKTSSKHDAITAAIFSLIVVVLTFD
ncbi:hypothetical protein [Bacillus sp. EB01]|uniref:hypothetical protein n=1 Tax=Bacillus sp. EB01 TaxID=1347086 RepID=UPI000A739127|nr:hypothetical protein [Bacillus sp. EB01]